MLGLLEPLNPFKAFGGFGSDEWYKHFLAGAGAGFAQGGVCAVTADHEQIRRDAPTWIATEQGIQFVVGGAAGTHVRPATDLEKWLKAELEQIKRERDAD